MGKGGTTIQQPAAPKYSESTREILQAQLELAPKLFAAESEYQPQYAKLQSQIEAQQAQAQMDLYQKLQPQYSQLENAYTTDLQKYQLQGLQERAPGYIQAFQQAQGTSGINDALKGYAENNLAKQMQAGFQLSPEEQRAINQQSLQGFSQSGTALGDQANLAGVLNRYQYSEGRKQQALQQASGIGSYLSQQAAPALASFYQQPAYAGTAGGGTIQNAMMGQMQSGPQYFNPESQTGMGGIYGAYNAQSQYAAGQAQANAAKAAGKSSMYGAIGAGVGTAALGIGLAVF